MEQQLARIADALDAIRSSLWVIQGSIMGIQFCLWLMFFIKDMGHDAASAIRSWRMVWNK